MGLIKFFSENFFLKRINEGKIHPYWDVAEDEDRAKQPGELVQAFGKIAHDQEVDKALKIGIERKHPDFVDNVFSHAAHHVPTEDLLTMAEYLARSPAFRTIAAKMNPIAMRTITRMVERVKLEDKTLLVRKLEANNTLTAVLADSQAMTTVYFFQKAAEGMTEGQAVQLAQQSPAWNSLNHGDTNFYEWVSETAPVFMDALNLRR